MSKPSRKLLWRPSADEVERATITAFARSRGLPEEYHDLWRWSVEHIDEFWAAIWDHFGVDGAHGKVLGSRNMPGATWFPGAQVNYASHIFKDKPGDRIAIHHRSESRPLGSWTWADLREHTARIRAGLKAHGVGEGDRVCAVLPNIPETIAAFLACASLGAIWSSAAPEFGARSIVDRFAQLQPKVLLAVDDYRYGGQDFDCTEKLAAVAAGLPGTQLVRFGYLRESGWHGGFASTADDELTFTNVPFEHPLWVLFSSGTTGLPKGIVHGHGGILLEYLKLAHLHFDAQADDRLFWFTTTGWAMWNILVGVLVTDASIVLYDGSPAGSSLWELAADAAITTFGTSAAFIAAAMKDGIEPAAGRDLSRLRAVGSTGSPLAPEAFRWIYDELGADTWLFSTSGGTDVASAFVGGVPTLPVYEGELQAPALGAALASWDENGAPLIGDVGELVLTKPMPSMPVSFWDDADGSRLRQSYFEHYPGVWRHGDWIEITERETAIIYGRSDSTINRGGIRMGTSEIYRAVLSLDEITDALVVDIPRGTGFEDAWMPLFVVLREGATLDDYLINKLRTRIREDCSPRHVPNEVHVIAEVPRTLSGKVLEVPVKRILMGQAPDQATSRDSLANPQALDYFVDLAGREENRMDP
jgi:acetoacetyl-CoA synthetase